MIRWTIEHVARLFTDGGFQAIANAHNAECGSNNIVTWHPPARPDKGIEGIDFPVAEEESMPSTINSRSTVAGSRR